MTIVHRRRRMPASTCREASGQENIRHRSQRGRCTTCGKRWPCPDSGYDFTQPIISGDWLPPSFLLGEGTDEDWAPAPPARDGTEGAEPSGVEPNADAGQVRSERSPPWPCAVAVAAIVLLAIIGAAGVITVLAMLGLIG